MKRTELFELAEEVDFAGRRMLAFHFQEEGYACQKASALLRQIAESTPEAWMHDGFVSTNKKRVEHDEMRNRGCGFKAMPIHTLYILPLED